MTCYYFGAHAIHSPEEDELFATTRDSLVESIQPASLVECILADELLHASWDMKRVRDNRDNTAAEARLNDAQNRASRNWHRATKAIKQVQSARAAALASFHYPDQIVLVAEYPLADVRKLPKPLFIPSYVKPEGK